MQIYMTVRLLPEFCNNEFIIPLNNELINLYGATGYYHFNCAQSLQIEADFLNDTYQGLKYLTHLKRPITKEMLSEYSFWHRHGEFVFCLTNWGSIEKAKDAVAVCKWLIKTECRFIDKTKSCDYGIASVRFYLNTVFYNTKYDTPEFWTIPESK